MRYGPRSISVVNNYISYKAVEDGWTNIRTLRVWVNFGIVTEEPQIVLIIDLLLTN